MGYKRKSKKLNKGFALPLVLMVVLVLSILFISIITIAQSNTRQVAIQEDNLRAYYLARSGIDIAYAALMDDNEKNFREFLNDSSPLVHSDLGLPSNDSPIGYVDIEVTDFSEDEVRIHAIARMAKGKGKSRLSLYIDKTNITRIRWVKE